MKQRENNLSTRKCLKREQKVPKSLFVTFSALIEDVLVLVAKYRGSSETKERYNRANADLDGKAVEFFPLPVPSEKKKAKRQKVILCVKERKDACKDQLHVAVEETLKERGEKDTK